MATKHTIICCDEEVSFTLETLEECHEGWLHVTSLSGPQMILCLFRQVAASRQIHYHAFSCGVLKVGEWELTGEASPADFNQIAEKTALLVEEFKAAMCIEKDLILQEYKKNKAFTYALFN